MSEREFERVLRHQFESLTSSVWADVSNIADPDSPFIGVALPGDFDG